VPSLDAGETPRRSTSSLGLNSSDMSHERSSWFLGLRALGQSQGFLTHAQFNDWLHSAIVDPEEISRIVDLLESAGIRIVPDSDAGK